jgi:hypothetical protein
LYRACPEPRFQVQCIGNEPAVQSTNETSGTQNGLHVSHRGTGGGGSAFLIKLVSGGAYLFAQRPPLRPLFARRCHWRRSLLQRQIRGVTRPSHPSAFAFAVCVCAARGSRLCLCHTVSVSVLCLLKSEVRSLVCPFASCNRVCLQHAGLAGEYPERRFLRGDVRGVGSLISDLACRLHTLVRGGGARRKRRGVYRHCRATASRGAGAQRTLPQEQPLQWAPRALLPFFRCL